MSINSSATTIAAADFSTRRLFALLLMPLIAMSMMVGALGFTATSAEASGYAQGYAKGKTVGRKHGYEDGFKGAYKASYIDEMIFGGNNKYARSDATSAEFIRGYKAGYKAGYEIGYRSGSSDGSQAGREDAKNWKNDLRDKMKECMRNGGYGC